MAARGQAASPTLGGEGETRFADEALAHMGQLRAAATAMTRNPHEAGDLVQETFTKAYARSGRAGSYAACSGPGRRAGVAPAPRYARER